MRTYSNFHYHSIFRILITTILLTTILLTAFNINCISSDSTKEQSSNDDWLLNTPVILDSDEKGSQRSMFTAYPMETLWMGSKPCVVMMRNPKEKPYLVFWQEYETGEWSKYATIPVGGFGEVFAINSQDIGYVGPIGRKNTGDYGKGIHFLRIVDGQARDTVLLVPTSDEGRTTVSTVETYGKSIFVFLLRETGQVWNNRLLFLSSDDEGASWSEVHETGTSNMHEDFSHMDGLCFDSLHMARILIEPAFNYLRVTDNGGESWKKVQLDLEYDHMNAKLAPLGRTIKGDSVGLIYAYIEKKNKNELKYCFTQSHDRAKTWSSPVFLTPMRKGSDPSMHIHIAKSADCYAFSYMETYGNWGKGEVRNQIIVSHDNGITWNEVSLDNIYDGEVVFSGLGGDPYKTRILLNSIIRVIEDEKERFYYTIQEYSPAVGGYSSDEKVVWPVK